MEIRGILFDLGGTLEHLSSSEQDQRQALSLMHHLLCSYDASFSMEQSEFDSLVIDGMARYKQWCVATCIELPASQIWSEWVFPAFPQQTLLLMRVGDMLCDIWETLYCKRALRDDARQTLQALKQMGYKLGVISNTTSANMPGMLMRSYGIDSFFDCFLLSSIEGIRKPDVRIFQKAARMLDIDPAACAYVGDQPSRDCRGPTLAGYATNVLIGNAQWGSDAQYVGHAVLGLSELPDLFVNISR